MKKTIPVLTVVAALVLLGSTSQSNAQAKDDGIAASPKMRQMLNERGAPMDKNASKALPSTGSVGYQRDGNDGIAASPKFRQIIDEGYAQNSAQLNYPQQVVVNHLGYRATGDDGITASPKLRQMLDERERAQGGTQVAPLK
jgi:hypothetical protein